MKAQIKRWLAPPVFEGDEEKTWRASLLNTTTIVLTISIVAVFIGNLIGGRTPTTVLVINVTAFTGILILRRLLFSGKVALTGIAVIVFGIILVTASAVSLGTIRTPTTAVFLLLVIIAGFLFGKKGLVLSIVSSSLAVLGLILAENAGMLPRPDYTVDITQWVTYTVFFGLTGALTYYLYQSTYRALKRVSKESADRKRAEEALKKSEEKFHTFADFTHDWEYWVAPDGEFIYNSPSVEKITGYKPEEFYQDKELLKKIVHPKDSDLLQKHIEERSKIFEERSIDFRIIKKNGEERWIGHSCKPIYDSEGKLLGNRGDNRDITERKRTEEELREANDIINQSPAVAFLWRRDEGWPVEFVTENVKDVFGYSAEDFLAGKVLYIDVICPEDLERINEEIKVANDNSKNGITEFVHKPYRIITKEGQVRWLDDRTKIRINESGKITHSQGIVLDITERKRTEEKLITSEEKYRTILENIGDGYFEVDIAGNFTIFNDSMCRILGYSKSEMLGMNNRNYMDKETVKDVYKAFNEIFRIKKAKKIFDWELIRKDKSKAFVSTSVTPIIDTSEDVVGFRGIVRDITEKKRAEEVILENEQRLELALKGADLGLWDWNFITGKVVRDERWAEMLGYTIDEIDSEDLSFENIVHPDDNEMVSKAWLDHFEGRTPLYETEHRVRHKSGDWIWILDRGKVFESDIGGNPIRVAGTQMDITEKKKVEEALKESQQRLELALQGANLGFWDIDLKAGILTHNERFTEIVGYSKDEIENRPAWWEKNIHPDDKHFTFEALISHIKGHTHLYNVEHRILSKSGEYVWVNDIGKVVEYDKKGDPVRMAGTTNDITKRRKAEEELKKHSEELERANEEIKNFTYIVSHDLKTPLINIRGYSDMVQSSMDELRSIVTPLMESLNEEDRDKTSKLMDKSIGKSLNTISNSAIRMGNMLSSIMTLSRLGRRKLDFEKVGISEIVNSAIMSFAHKTEEQKIKISVGELPEILADKSSMEIVFRNLLTNAVNYLDPERKGEIEVGCDEGKNETIFYVRDNGVGIGEKDIEKIFRIFRRAGKQDVPGEGMGLAYVKTMVERRGGSIWCESEPGVGSTFYFTILNDLEIK